MTNQDKIDKAAYLINTIMGNYQVAATLAQKEGYETNYEQDNILVGFLMGELIAENLEDE